jgi:hypothetical protein
MSRFTSLIVLLFACSTVQALTFRLSDEEVVGHSLIFETTYEDISISLGRSYGLGYRELIGV